MAGTAFRFPASKILPILRDEICPRPPSSAPFLHPTRTLPRNISSLIERSEAERIRLAILLCQLPARNGIR